jgi:hypothetical protein
MSNLLYDSDTYVYNVRLYYAVNLRFSGGDTTHVFFLSLPVACGLIDTYYPYPGQRAADIYHVAAE